jgi:threonine dehydrogenase-like Zn-dependent dehydrogenase
MVRSSRDLTGTWMSSLANTGLIMKVGIIGAGRVGCACALAAVARGSARAIVLVDRTRKRAKAVATDLRYGSPLCPKATIVDGDYDDLTDAALVMITAGINGKAGGATDRNDPEGRLRLAGIDSNDALSDCARLGDPGSRPALALSEPDRVGTAARGHRH